MSKRMSKPAANGSVSIRRTASAVAVAAVAAVAVSACGSSSSGSSSTSSTSSSGGSGGAPSNGVTSKSAEQIFNTAITAAKAAKSVHVSGALKSGSQSVGLDLSIVQGTGASGTISEGAVSFKLISIGGSYYIQPSAGFLQKFVHSAAAASLFKGKWLKASSSNSSFGSFGQLTSIKTLIGSLPHADGTLSKGSTSTLAGQPVIAVDSSKGGTMYVATTGTAYPLQVSKNSGGQSGKITFSDYNKPFTITAPANSINIDQLTSGGG
jgi:hypothetical protein